MLKVIAVQVDIDETYRDIKLLNSTVTKQLDSAKITTINQKLNGITKGLTNSMDWCDCKVMSYPHSPSHVNPCTHRPEKDCKQRGCDEKGYFMVLQAFANPWNAMPNYECCRPCLNL